MEQWSENNAASLAQNAQKQPANSASLPPHHSHPRGPITIVAYNTTWPSTYTSESQRVRTALNNAGFAPSLVAIEHIGSTSVPGLGAKPIVDIMIGVQKQADLNAFPIATMNELGYTHRPFPVSSASHPTSAASRLLFSKYDPPSTNVHVFVYQDKHWNGHLAVRNYLRTHASAAALYEHVKRIRAAQHGNNLGAYGKSKRSFIDSLEWVALGHPSPRKGVIPKRAPIASSLQSPVSGGGSAGVGPKGGTGGSSSGGSQPVHLGDPTGWQTGVWYIQQPDGTWMVSPDQDPLHDATPGMFAEYNGFSGGEGHWVVVGHGENSSEDSGTPSNDEMPPDAGTPDTAPPYTYTATITRDDGTTYTEVLIPPNALGNTIPPNAKIIYESDGSVLLLYNNDGSSWDDGSPGWNDPNDDDSPGGFGGYEYTPY